ncbi:hypothetical protein YDYSY3_44000 [Paenibacillus chitinolyticus]|uniref:hypothetical protein n=1 Tax=Paenibacillus chitinolyticus TaxID=79263 RepID=UPI0026E4FFD4|nr:hypothetical protein [Paenibacillus chitinolyticus]GKS13400.1 hypothetical protein YDYSY3_44000 [Paenibacillus chitinolyticus]
MKTLRLEPLRGIDLNEAGYVAFGQTVQQVKLLLGEPSRAYDKQLFYDELELRIDLNDEDRVEFMECIFGPCCEKTIPLIYEERPFELSGEALIALLTEKNNGIIDDTEAEYGYSFMEISVGIYRQATPADLLESIEEAKAEGTYEEDCEWLENDLRKANHFWTIGIGEKGYYTAL